MPKPDIENKFNLRSKGGYIPFKNLGIKFKKTFFPHTTILWNNLPKNVQSMNTTDFKEYINKERKPPKYKHFANKGSKKSNLHLTKIRVGRSDLNQHKFTIGQIESPQCECFFREESSSHYFLDCFLYQPERQILFDHFEHYIPNFKNFTKHKKLEILLKGVNVENEEFYKTNITLTLAVQNFILHTNRFS